MFGSNLSFKLLPLPIYLYLVLFAPEHSNNVLRIMFYIVKYIVIIMWSKRKSTIAKNNINAECCCNQKFTLDFIVLEWCEKDTLIKCFMTISTSFNLEIFRFFIAKVCVCVRWLQCLPHRIQTDYIVHILLAVHFNSTFHIKLCP